MTKEKKYLIALTQSVAVHISLMDRLVAKPFSKERGRQLASLANTIEMENDLAMRFGLDMSAKKVANLRAKAEKAPL